LCRRRHGPAKAKGTTKAKGKRQKAKVERPKWAGRS
jgi:hypothetical protein